MYSIEDVVDGEVIVLEVLSSKLGNGWTLSKEVGDGFLFLSTGGARTCVAFPYIVEVFVKSAVARNEVDCRSVLVSLVIEVLIEIVNDLGVLVPK